MNSNEIILKVCLLTLLKPKYESIIDIHVKFDEHPMVHSNRKHGSFSVYFVVTDGASEFGLNYGDIYTETFKTLLLCNLHIINNCIIGLVIAPITK